MRHNDPRNRLKHGASENTPGTMDCSRQSMETPRRFSTVSSPESGREMFCDEEYDHRAGIAREACGSSDTHCGGSI